MAKKKTVLYDPTLEVEKKEFFVGTKIGKRLSDTVKVFESMPVGLQWFITLMVSSIISGVVGVAVMIYFNIGIQTIADINIYLKIQFIFDFIVIMAIAVFAILLIKEAKS